VYIEVYILGVMSVGLLFDTFSVGCYIQGTRKGKGKKRRWSGEMRIGI
jgi:hypothetical protein